jgi:hypothetical protein
MKAFFIMFRSPLKNLTPHQGVRNATTNLNCTTVNTKPNDGMKNAKRWESLSNALYA